MTLRHAALAGLLLAPLLGLVACRNQPSFTIPVCDGPDEGCRCALHAQSGPPNWTICNSVCVNLQFDHENCGWCGHGCGSDGVCDSGVCYTGCASPHTQCGNECKYDGDPFHCGPGCGVACDGACVNGQCQPFATTMQRCPANTLPCNSGCFTSFDYDPKNCGQCGNVCPSSAPDCVNGKCQ